MPNIQPSASGGGFDRNVDPASVNTPFIFEPSSDLAGASGQIWAVVSGGTNFGGAVASLSFDGVTYSQVGFVGASAYQGTLTADLPSHADPDGTDTLSIDLTQSAGVLPASATDADADAFRTLALLIGPTTTNIGSNAELVAYGAVTATGTYTSNLTYLRRGLFGTSIADHPSGSMFIRLQREQVGQFGSILAFVLPAQYVGTAIHLKFQSFNSFGNALQDISEVTAYSYTPSGLSFGIPAPATGIAPAKPVSGWKDFTDTDGALKSINSAGTVRTLALP